MKATSLQYEIRQYGIVIYLDPESQMEQLRISGSVNCYFEITESNLDSMNRKVALVAKLYKLAKVPADCSLSLIALKTMLQSIGTQIVRDERTGKLHTHDTMPNPLLVSYADDYESMSLQYSRYHVLAIGPTQAQRLILADAAANGASDSWISQFVGAGMPVCTVKYGNAPQWIDWQV